MSSECSGLVRAWPAQRGRTSPTPRLGRTLLAGGPWWSLCRARRWDRSSAYEAHERREHCWGERVLRQEHPDLRQRGVNILRRWAFDPCLALGLRLCPLGPPLFLPALRRGERGATVAAQNLQGRWQFLRQVLAGFSGPQTHLGEPYQLLQQRRE